MPKRRVKGLCSELNRHGTRVWYYREGQGPRTRIHGAYGSLEFNAAVTAASRGAVAPLGKTMLSHTDPNSFGWLVDEYLKSSELLQMRAATQKARRNTLKAIVDAGCGAEPFRELTDVDIRALRDEKAATGKVPMANRTVDILRVFFDWAVEIKKVLRTNPCLGVKAIKHKGGTNHPWTDAEMLRFEQAYPLGTRERLAYALLLYTGQRSNDVVLMGHQHAKDGLLSIQQGKTSKWVHVPVLAVLAEAIAATPTGLQTFLLNDEGAPLTVSHFGVWFRAACDRAGVPQCTPHGLRHAGATRLASRGADASALTGIYGFTLAVAQRYIQTANMSRSIAKDIHLLNHAA
jgi:integrase